jgi:Spy/CpxP family protein refolding chaperone
MKNPLRILAAVFAIAIASVPAHAQPPGGGMNMQERAAQQRAQLFEGITLTEEQKAKVDTIYAEQARKQQELMQAAMGGGGMGPEMREKMTAMRNEQHDAIRKVLTKEQLEVFEKNLAAMPQGGGRRPPFGG